MNQVQTTIVTVNARNTSRGQVWDVIDGQGVKYTAFEPAQAQKAMSLLNQPVLLSFTEKPSSNPQYGPNRSFKDAMPFQGAAPQPASLTAVDAMNIAIQQKGHLVAPPAISSGPTDKDAQIIRQSAYKAAVDLCSPLVSAGVLADEVMAEVRRVTDELVAYGLTGSWGGASVAAEPAPVPAAADAAPWE